MVKLVVDYDEIGSVWFVKTSDLSGIHGEGDTLDELCGKLPAIVNDLVESNQDRKAGTCYCSFCGKSQHEVQQLIAGPAVFTAAFGLAPCWRDRSAAPCAEWTSVGRAG